jgi:serine/threonine protein kinase
MTSLLGAEPKGIGGTLRRRSRGSQLMIVNRAAVEAALPGYEVGPQLGRGAFGLVLAGRDRLRRDVAIKILPGIAGEGGPQEGTGEAETEALTLAGLDHPHIVRVYDYVPGDDISVIVMELVGGGSLRIRARAGLSTEMVCAVGLTAATALGYAHSRDVLHRDVKPENMLFTVDGVLKVTDFGIAKAFGGTTALASKVVGTPRYMAPEQFLLGGLRPATDLYALGVILYELLTGRPPFVGEPESGETLRECHLDLPPPPVHGAPAQIAAVVTRSLAKDARDRYATGRELAVDLARAATDSLGHGWLARVDLPLNLDEEIRAAVTHRSPAAPARTAVPTVGRPPRLRRLDPRLRDSGAVDLVTPPVLAPPVQTPERPERAGSPVPGRGQLVGDDRSPLRAETASARSATPFDIARGAERLVVNPRRDAEYRRSGRRAAMLAAAAAVGIMSVLVVAVVLLAH